jgi:hypothetical protein
MESINIVIDGNIKEFVKKNLNNIIKITEETSSEHNKKKIKGEFLTCF